VHSNFFHLVYSFLSVKFLGLFLYNLCPLVLAREYTDFSKILLCGLVVVIHIGAHGILTVYISSSQYEARDPPRVSVGSQREYFVME